MASRGQRAPKPPLGDPNDPDGFGVWAARYLEALRIRNYSERTVGNQESYLRLFVAWCEARNLTRPQEVTKPILDRYQRHLFHLRKPSGKALTFASQARALSPVRSFFKWLTRQNVLLWNPASEIEMPKQERRLPKHVLTIEEAERILAGADVAEPLGVRDRAMLETLYSTGIRRMELIALQIYDLDVERGTLFVRQGKGRKDRTVPIGERAVAWIERYLREVRPGLVVPPDPGALFLTLEGDAVSAPHQTDLVRRYVTQAEIGKTGSCHLFRHTCATLMLEGGADVRYVQEMLGHAELSSTQLYTRVSIRRLKAVHALTHPSAKIERPAQETTAATEASVAAVTDSAFAADAEGALTARRTGDEAATLLATLAAELADDAEEAADEALRAPGSGGGR